MGDPGATRSGGDGIDRGSRRRPGAATQETSGGVREAPELELDHRRVTEPGGQVEDVALAGRIERLELEQRLLADGDEQRQHVEGRGFTGHRLLIPATRREKR